MADKPRHTSNTQTSSTLYILGLVMVFLPLIMVIALWFLVPEQRQTWALLMVAVCLLLAYRVAKFFLKRGSK